MSVVCPIPVICCPFCGREFGDEDRELIAQRLDEQDENGEYKFPQFRIICRRCNGEVRLIRRTDYYDEESVPS